MDQRRKEMRKWATFGAVLLLAGIGLAYSSCNMSGNAENSICEKNGVRSTNITEGFSSICPNYENCTGKCTCLNNTMFCSNNCTYQNCTYKVCANLESDAFNNSSNNSCSANGPRPIAMILNSAIFNNQKRAKSS